MRSCSVVSDSLRPLWAVARQAALFMGFCRQEYWSGLPCPATEAFLNPEIKPASLTSPVLAGGFFTTTATGKQWFVPLFSFVCSATKAFKGTSCETTQGSMGADEGERERPALGRASHVDGKGGMERL